MTTEELERSIDGRLRGGGLNNALIDRLNEAVLRLGFLAPVRAARFGRQILAQATANDYGRGCGYALRNIGWCELNVDDCRAAEKTLAQSRKIFAAERDRAGTASVYNALATARRKIGDFKTALEHYAAALDVFDAARDAAGSAGVLLNIGIVHNQSGDYASALDYYYRALPLAAQVGAKEITARTHACLGDVLWRVEEGDSAIQSARTAIAIFEENPDGRNLSVALVNLGAAYQHRGNFAEASNYYRQSLESARANGNLETETEALKCLGTVELQTGALDSAIAHLEQALNVGRGINHRYFESETLLALGSAYEKLGNRNLSVELLQTAQSLSEECNFEEINYRTHLALSEIYQKENQSQSALRHLLAYQQIWRKIHNAPSLSRIQRLLFRQEIVADAADANEAAANDNGLLAPRKLREVVAFINHHLEHHLPIAKLAEIVGLSQNYFLILFKKTTGKTPHQFLLERRVAHACQLLKTTDLPLVEIALQCGFSSQSHFTTHFRIVTGVTPNQYRRRRLS